MAETRYGAAVRSDPQGAVVTVWAVPGSSRTQVVGLHDSAVRVRVGAPARDGRANVAIARVLRGAMGARVDLLSGATARRKRFLIRGLDAPTVATRLELATKR